MTSIMEQPLINEYPDYKTQVDKMYKIINDSSIDNDIRGNTLGMFAEFNEAFYPLMCKLVDILNNIEEKDFLEDKNAGISKEQEDFIKWVGEFFHKRGGLTTQQKMFYVMNNIMGCERVYILNCMWNNIGDWKW